MKPAVVLRQLLHYKRVLLLYRAKPDGVELCKPEAFYLFVGYADIPLPWRGVVLPRGLANVMLCRLLAGRAMLVCYSEDGQTLLGYGWIQKWAAFRRRFGLFARDAWMLGPFWTAPAARGHGIYRSLLCWCRSYLRGEKDLFIYTSPDNIPSQRGIASAGFEPVGAWEMTVWLRLVVRWTRID
ncbi:MAG: hypothetical protein LLG45_03700 [Actinomycetia bacterium]|nr:hypothetical protein [Actinomycetes bacterium]